MAGNAWFTAAIVLFTSAVVWRWMKRATGQQLVVDELEFEDEAVVINSPVAGEEPIQRMPGPGNQPPYQMVMGMLSAASSGRRRSVSDICGDGDPLEFISLLSRSNNARTPQARTPVSETDDESEQMSTGHVPGKIFRLCRHSSEMMSHNDPVKWLLFWPNCIRLGPLTLPDLWRLHRAAPRIPSKQGLMVHGTSGLTPSKG